MTNLKVPKLEVFNRNLDNLHISEVGDSQFRLFDKESGSHIECSRTFISSFRRLMGITAQNYSFNEHSARDISFSFLEHFNRAQSKYGRENFQLATLNGKAVNLMEKSDSYLKSEQVQEFVDKITDGKSQAITEFNVDNRNNLNITFNREEYAGNSFSVSGEDFEAVLKMKIPLHATSTTMAKYYIESVRLACLNGMIGTSDAQVANVKYSSNETVQALMKSLEQKRNPMPEEIEEIAETFKFLRTANPHVGLIYKVFKSLNISENLKPYAVELANKFGLNRYDVSQKECHNAPTIKNGALVAKKENLVSAYEVYNFLTEVNTHGVGEFREQFDNDDRRRLHLACKTLLNTKNYVFRGAVDDKRDYDDFYVDHNPFEKANKLANSESKDSE
jgi:hypothetical protein